MQKIALSFFVLWTLTLADCQSKSAKVKQFQDQYNAEYPAYAKECIAKKKEREAQCKPEADRLAQSQKEIITAQQ
jgi:hypothetical protein